MIILTLELTGIPVDDPDRQFPWPKAEFIPRTSTRSNLVFDVSIFEGGAADFIFPLNLYQWRLQQLEEAAKEGAGLPGVKVIDYYYDDSKDSKDTDRVFDSYECKIAEIHVQEGDETHIQRSGFNSLELRYPDGSHTDASPWDLDVCHSKGKCPLPSCLTESQKEILFSIIDKLGKEEDFLVFSAPVDTNIYVDYFSMIEVPMDFSMIRNRLQSNYYTNIYSVKSDMKLIIDNCKKYNDIDSDISKEADNMFRTFEELFDEKLVDEVALRGTRDRIDSEEDQLNRQESEEVGNANYVHEERRRPTRSTPIQSSLENIGIDSTSISFDEICRMKLCVTVDNEHFNWMDYEDSENDSQNNDESEKVSYESNSSDLNESADESSESDHENKSILSDDCAESQLDDRENKVRITRHSTKAKKVSKKIDASRKTRTRRGAELMDSDEESFQANQGKCNNSHLKKRQIKEAIGVNNSHDDVHQLSRANRHARVSILTEQHSFESLNSAHHSSGDSDADDTTTKPKSKARLRIHFNGSSKKSEDHSSPRSTRATRSNRRPTSDVVYKEDSSSDESQDRNKASKTPVVSKRKRSTPIASEKVVENKVAATPRRSRRTRQESFKKAQGKNSANGSNIDSDVEDAARKQQLKAKTQIRNIRKVKKKEEDISPTSTRGTRSSRRSISDAMYKDESEHSDESSEEHVVSRRKRSTPIVPKNAMEKTGEKTPRRSMNTRQRNYNTVANEDDSDVDDTTTKPKSKARLRIHFNRSSKKSEDHSSSPRSRSTRATRSNRRPTSDVVYKEDSSSDESQDRNKASKTPVVSKRKRSTPIASEKVVENKVAATPRRSRRTAKSLNNSKEKALPSSGQSITTSTPTEENRRSRSSPRKRQRVNSYHDLSHSDMDESEQEDTPRTRRRRDSNKQAVSESPGE